MKRRCIAALVMVLALFMLAIPVYGLTPVETDRICTVTVEGYPGEGAHFYLYKVADADERMEFTLTETFKPYEKNVIVNDIHDQETWVDLAATLSSYVYGDGISFTAGGYIQNGICQFTVETGLYLMLSDPVEYDGWIYHNIPMLISVPTGDDYIPNVEEWIYDYSIVPKYEREKPEYGEIEYKVIKQWQDGKGEKRPANITVNILKNGIVEEQIILNKENDWCYTWKTADDGSVWQVLEVDIPEDYKVTNRQNQTIYTILNYTDAPLTSDSPVSRKPIAALCISGTIALLSGYLLLKNRKEETD